MNHQFYPQFPRRVIHDLNGIWDFAFLGDVDEKSVNANSIKYTDLLCVPSAFDAMPSYAAKRGLAAYRKTVAITPGADSLLQFDAVSMWCRIFVDGKALCDHHNGYTQFWCKVPASSRQTRELVVLIDNRFNYDRTPLHEEYFDFYQYGGILRSASWHEVGETYITHTAVTTTDLAAGKILLKLRLGGKGLKNSSVSISIDNGPERKSELIFSQKNEAALELSVENPTPWSPSSPSLHTLTISLPADATTVRFGLRTVEVSGTDILLNGTPIRLKGYCRHDAHAQYGPALPLTQLVEDLQLLRDMGCNFVRGTHYPQDQRFLDLCDEMGFLVWEEQLGWHQKARQLTNPLYTKHYLETLNEMVEASINHPCVILWGFSNEADSWDPVCKPFYHQMARRLKELDSSRPITYASCNPGKDVCLDTVDVISYNIYPGWYEGVNLPDPLSMMKPRIREIADKLGSVDGVEKPIIISEIGAECILGWHDRFNQQYTEEWQAEYLHIACESILENKRYAGISLWQFCDCRVPASLMLGRPRCYNNKGTFDEYRRPKMAAKEVAQIFKKFP